MSTDSTYGAWHVKSAGAAWSGTPAPGRIEEMAPVLVAARPRLLRLARLRGVPADLAEDVVQEALLEAWKCLDRLYDASGADRWLDEICRNVCRRYARKNATEQRHALPLAHSDDASDGEPDTASLNAIADDTTPDPIEALNRQDAALLLDRALGLLPGVSREVVDLCYLRETPQREATERLGLSLSALEARLHRARRQLRAVFNGPLRVEAEAFGLALDDEIAQGWQETRQWCTLCGQRRLSGMFLVQPDGSVNLHVRCSGCEQRYGLCDIDSNSVHSKGLVALAGLRSFRPAWKRTMLGTAQRFTQALRSDGYRCLYCGSSASIHLMDKTQMAALAAESVPLDSLARHPYRFWVWWRCHGSQADSSEHSGLFAASDLVAWSCIEVQQFMRDHPHCVSEPELLVEHAGVPALRLQMADATCAARLTVLADRQTLRILAVH
ncbi:MAG TPA: sigma-70 family RNA polymerase sigma factor [Ktedonobacterales bacterium]